MKSRPVNNGNENMASEISTCAVIILFVLHSITAQCHKVLPFFFSIAVTITANFSHLNHVSTCSLIPW